MFRGGHEDYFSRFIDFIKKPPRANAVTPSLRLPISEFAYVGTEMGLFADLRVNIRPELFFNLEPQVLVEVF